MLSGRVPTGGGVPVKLYFLLLWILFRRMFASEMLSESVRSLPKIERKLFKTVPGEGSSPIGTRKNEDPGVAL